MNAYRGAARLARRHAKGPKGKRAEGRATARLNQAAAALDRELRLVVHAKGALRRVKGLRPFVQQTAVFLRSARLAARTGLLATSLLRVPAGSAAQGRLRRQLAAARKRSFADPYETYGSRLHYFSLTGNVMDRYVERVQKIDAVRSRHSRGPG